LAGFPGVLRFPIFDKIAVANIIDSHPRALAQGIAKKP
jgi:hypothetical protein